MYFDFAQYKQSLKFSPCSNYKQKGLVQIIVVILILLTALTAGGVVYYTKQIKPTPTPTPNQSGSGQASSDETIYPEATQSANPDSIGANWKTYTITKMFEFRYPLEDYSVLGLGGLSCVWPGQTFVRPNDAFSLNSKSKIPYELFICAEENTENLNTQDSGKFLGYKTNEELKKFIPDIIIKQATIGGIKGVRFDNIPGQGDPITQIYVVVPKDNIYKNGLIYQFTIEPTLDENQNNDIEDIISSFKFLP